MVAEGFEPESAVKKKALGVWAVRGTGREDPDPERADHQVRKVAKLAMCLLNAGSVATNLFLAGGCKSEIRQGP